MMVEAMLGSVWHVVKFIGVIYVVNEMTLRVETLTQTIFRQDFVTDDNKDKNVIAYHSLLWIGKAIMLSTAYILKWLIERIQRVVAMKQDSKTCEAIKGKGYEAQLKSKYKNPPLIIELMIGVCSSISILLFTEEQYSIYLEKLSEFRHNSMIVMYVLLSYWFLDVREVMGVGFVNVVKQKRKGIMKGDYKNSNNRYGELGGLASSTISTANSRDNVVNESISSGPFQEFTEEEQESTITCTTLNSSNKNFTLLKLKQLSKSVISSIVNINVNKDDVIYNLLKYLYLVYKSLQFSFLVKNVEQVVNNSIQYDHYYGMWYEQFVNENERFNDFSLENHWPIWLAVILETVMYAMIFWLRIEVNDNTEEVSKNEQTQLMVTEEEQETSQLELTQLKKDDTQKEQEEYYQDGKIQQHKGESLSIKEEQLSQRVFGQEEGEQESEYRFLEEKKEVVSQQEQSERHESNTTNDIEDKKITAYGICVTIHNALHNLKTTLLLLTSILKYSIVSLIIYSIFVVGDFVETLSYVFVYFEEGIWVFLEYGVSSFVIYFIYAHCLANESHGVFFSVIVTRRAFEKFSLRYEDEKFNSQLNVIMVIIIMTCLELVLIEYIQCRKEASQTELEQHNYEQSEFQSNPHTNYNPN